MKCNAVQSGKDLLHVVVTRGKIMTETNLLSIFEMSGAY